MAGSAGRKCEGKKRDKFVLLCQAADMTFTPLVFETFGAWGQNMQKFFADCVGRMENKLEEGELRSWAAMTFKQAWLQRISCTLMRGVTKCIRHRARRDFVTAGVETTCR